MRTRALLALLCLTVLATSVAFAADPGADVRLTNDQPGEAHAGYVSNDTLSGRGAYSDYVLDECSRSRGRQNEPAVEIDPRNSQVLVGSSNDYCGVYANPDPAAAPSATGPIWLGYYRSENGGAYFTSSLVPGYPGDTSAAAALSKLRTASAGDPVLAWDKHGRLFAGMEASDDPAGTPKGFGDTAVATFINSDSAAGTLNDGKRFARAVVVAKGSSAPNYNGVFHDKTAIEADRTTSACEGNVYYSWSRFSGSGGEDIYFARSTDHGVTFSNPMKISGNAGSVQNPDIAVTSDGHVSVVFRRYAQNASGQSDAVMLTRSTDCGKTFGKPRVVTTFVPFDVTDNGAPAPAVQSAPDDAGGESGKDSGGTARDCGELADRCATGYTFFREDTQTRAAADQDDADHRFVHIVFEASKPTTLATANSTYTTAPGGKVSQAGAYYVRVNDATGDIGDVAPMGPNERGHQILPDIAVDSGTLHALWWDTRNQATWNIQLPIGDRADGSVENALDVYAVTKSATSGPGSWSSAVPVTDETTNPNYDQFDNRQTPFAGDYLWISASGGNTYGVWTDWRKTVPGTDPRIPESYPAGGEVHQCRTQDSTGAWSSDQCPRDGGIDQNIFGDHTP